MRHSRYAALVLLFPFSLSLLLSLSLPRLFFLLLGVRDKIPLVFFSPAVSSGSSNSWPAIACPRERCPAVLQQFVVNRVECFDSFAAEPSIKVVFTIVERHRGALIVGRYYYTIRYPRAKARREDGFLARSAFSTAVRR